MLLLKRHLIPTSGSLCVINFLAFYSFHFSGRRKDTICLSWCIAIVRAGVAVPFSDRNLVEDGHWGAKGHPLPSVLLPVQLTHIVLSHHLEQACLNLAFSLLKKRKKYFALRCILQRRIKTHYSISKH